MWMVHPATSPHGFPGLLKSPVTSSPPDPTGHTQQWPHTLQIPTLVNPTVYHPLYLAGAVRPAAAGLQPSWSSRLRSGRPRRTELLCLKAPSLRLQGSRKAFEV